MVGITTTPITSFPSSTEQNNRSKSGRKRKMANLSTLTELLWLTLFVGSSWAGKVESWTEWSTRGLSRVSQKPGENDGEKLSDVPTKAWMNLLHGAVVAFEANKYETGLTLVTGVYARTHEMKWGKEDDRQKFKKAGQLIEEALAADNKVKAIALINALTAEMAKSGLAVVPDVAGVRTKSRELREEDEKRKVILLHDCLKQAYRHIEKNEFQKAENILQDVYQLLKEVPAKETKTDKFLSFKAALDQTEKYIKQGAKDKAAAALEDAARMARVQLGEHEEMSTGSKQDHHGAEKDDTNTQEIKKQMLEKFLRQAITAIKGEERVKAEKMLRAIYQILKNDKNMATEEKAIKFLEAIQETMKYIKADARDKAEQALHEAVLDFGIQTPQVQVRNRKTGASDSEL